MTEEMIDCRPIKSTKADSLFEVIDDSLSIGVEAGPVLAGPLFLAVPAGPVFDRPPDH